MKQFFLICVLVAPLFVGCSNIKDNNEESQYYNPNIGLSFSYLPEWTFDETGASTGSSVVVGHAPIEYGYFKVVRISLYDDEDLEIAIKRQWLAENDRNKVAENKLYFGPIRTHHYAGITYAANRAQVDQGEKNTVLDYRMFATRNNGKTIVLCELAEVGGLDGFEAEGFNLIEKTIQYHESN